jgi:hypothetical protein
MTPTTAETINEVDFCGKMATAATAFFATIRDRCPFVEVRIEDKGSIRSKDVRKDMRFYGAHNRVLLTSAMCVSPKSRKWKTAAPAAAPSSPSLTTPPMLGTPSI